MELYNDMEAVVSEELERLLLEAKDICKCEKCRLDILAWVLNRLPPRYIVSEKGRFYTRLKEQEVQFRADVVRELTSAIIQVGRNPQH